MLAASTLLCCEVCQLRSMAQSWAQFCADEVWEASLLSPQVMHSDLKTKNVLLSNTMNAKISDVGLAQLVDAHSENAPVLAL